jgi:2-keto-4-pentenoate hydratase/2-oxohepta-3-ene-1,7-dioic acid hydratase in catechol pathway
VDFEAELAVVIGQNARNCSQIDSEKIIFGYTCANDISARDLQFGDGQWVRGKSLDTFCPMGPYIVTRDEIPDPHSLNIQCRLNGSVMQDSNTREMIFSIPEIIHFCSRHFTLTAGDIILTGTPQGVGAFRSPPSYLKDGDEVEVEIQGIGRLKNRCRTI